MPETSQTTELTEPEKITQEELQQINFEDGEKVHIFSDNLDWPVMSEIADKALQCNVAISFSSDSNNNKKCNRIFHIV